MKILMILESEFPPDIRVEKEIRSLIKVGHKIVLACSSPASEDEIISWNGATIIRKNMPRFIYKSSVGCLQFPFYFNFWRKFLKGVFTQNKFDAIHLHDLPLAKVAKEFSLKHKISFVLDLHENWPALIAISQHTKSFLGQLLSSNKQWIKYEKVSIQKADRVIVVVQEAKERLVKLGVQEEKITIVSNTIEIADFIIPEIPINNRFTLIYAGGLNEHRGLHIALDAVKKVVTNIPCLNFLIIGEGRYRKTLEQKVQDLKLNNNVNFTGWLCFDDMLKLLSSSHVGLIPHLRNEHTDTTIPHKLFQYFAAGKPIISSDCFPMKRILLETETGLVYKNDNPNELANAIITLFEDHDLYKRIQQNQQQALKKYNWSQDSTHLVALYQDIAK
ncbi:MAG: glycosyltransferase family 4 protein [Candidatus Cloacimonetes bacterium]|nr:glycosyltransferase family 4 protein [Candidatus Cloacimonadota bacterium]